MIANRKGFRSYASVVTVGLFLSSTLLAAAGEVSPSGVRLLEGNEVVSFDRPGQASRLGVGTGALIGGMGNIHFCDPANTAAMCAPAARGPRPDRFITTPQSKPEYDTPPQATQPYRQRRQLTNS